MDFGLAVLWAKGQRIYLPVVAGKFSNHLEVPGKMGPIFGDIWETPRAYSQQVTQFPISRSLQSSDFAKKNTQSTRERELSRLESSVCRANLTRGHIPLEDQLVRTAGDKLAIVVCYPERAHIQLTGKINQALIDPSRMVVDTVLELSVKTSLTS